MTYVSPVILIANEENVKVVQEHMQHASVRYTLDVYSQARIRAKREAQERVVEMILPADADVPEPAINGNDSGSGSR